MKLLTRLLFVVISVGLLIAATPASAAGVLATARAGSSGVEWHPTVAGVGFSLTVSGPEGFYLQQQFAPGEAPAFSVFDAAGNLRPAGNYAYELRAIPQVDPATRDELQGLRDQGEDAVRGALQKAGKLPAGPTVQSGYFAVVGGAIEMGGKAEPPAAGDGGNRLATKGTILTGNDGIIYNSLCVGFDCPTSPTFSDSTILMMENNTRIKFGDTSNSPFPNEDWEIEANSASSGGQSYLGFNDCGSSDNDGGCASDLVFAVEAGARQNALYVESDGDVGIGTSNPVLELHIVRGDSPGVRLEQDASSGFSPQTWDVVGNETSFFVRDVTNGSTLPFRIRPGAASNSLVIDTDDDVGVGILSPGASLHVWRNDGSASLKVEEASTTESARELAQFSNDGTVTYRFTDTQGTASTGDDFNWIAGLKTNNQFIITLVGTIASPLWRIDSSGNVTATSFNPTSSRALKEGFTAIDPRQVLEQVVAMPISEWRYKKDVTSSRHLGPVAEDFRAAFGLGADGQHISVTDLGGVSLAAIQGLDQALGEKDQRIRALEQANQQLLEAQDALARQVQVLQEQVASLLVTQGRP
jgi:hypothetical protein